MRSYTQKKKKKALRRTTLVHNEPEEKRMDTIEANPPVIELKRKSNQNENFRLMS